MDLYLQPVNDDYCFNEFDTPIYLHQESKVQKMVCKDFSNLTRTLAESLIQSDKNFNLYVDWTECIYHPLIFKIDIRTPIKNTSKILMTYFNEIFIKILEEHLNYSIISIILAMRRSRSGGMLIHVLDVKISHDDYIHLCNKMYPRSFYRCENIVIELDCPNKMSLIACDLSQTMDDLYIPITVLQFENSRKSNIFTPRKVERLNLKYYDTFTKSLFDRIKYPLSQVVDAASLMMPISDLKDNSKTLFFPTRIIHFDDKYHSVMFLCYLNYCRYAIIKEDKLSESENLSGSFCYQFLKRNAKIIGHFTSSENEVLAIWYKRFAKEKTNKNILFPDISERLARECFPLNNVPNPIQKIITHEHLIKPIYYALCNILKIRYEPYQIALKLNEIHPNKDILPKIRIWQSEMEMISNHLSFDTILYCAYKITSNELKDSQFWKNIGMGWDWILECTQTEKEIQIYIKYIQEKFFPIKKDTSNIYAWDPFIERWLVIQNIKDDLKTIVETIYRIITYFDGFFKMPSQLRTKLNVSDNWMVSIANSILDEINQSKAIRGVKSLKLGDFKQYLGMNLPQYYLFDLPINM